MPRRAVLTERQRAALFDLPTDEAALVRHYTLSDDDLTHIRRRRRPQNRLGFALQLCALRYPGRLLQPGEVIPEAVLAFIGAQIGVASGDLLDYGAREATRYTHSSDLQRLYDYRPFEGLARREIAHWLTGAAEAAQSSNGLAATLLAELRDRRIIAPGISIKPTAGPRPGMCTTSRYRARVTRRGSTPTTSAGCRRRLRGKTAKMRLSISFAGAGSRGAITRWRGPPRGDPLPLNETANTGSAPSPLQPESAKPGGLEARQERHEALPALVSQPARRERVGDQDGMGQRSRPQMISISNHNAENGLSFGSSRSRLSMSDRIAATR